MAAPETAEQLSFRRTFTLVILLVVLPSAGVSGFGVVAIVNERAVVEKRLTAAWSSRLAVAQRVLLETFDRAEVRATTPTLVLEAGDLTLTGPGFTVDDQEVTADDARLAAALRALGAELLALPSRPVVFSVSSPQGTWLVAAVRDGGRVLGARVAMAAVEQLLERQRAAVGADGEQARFALVPIKREVPPEGMVARLVSGVSEVREAALGPAELSSVTLPPPLQDFRLVVYAQGEDPVAAASWRNRVVYGVLLLIFYVTLALGVVYTGRTLYREARLSRLKTDFVSLVSHELRTPLTSIRMFIDMLAMGRVKDPAELQTTVDVLSKETARLSNMIESMLDWSRIESGRKEYRRERTSPRELVDAAAAAFQAQHLGEPPELTVSVPEGLPAVDVDPDALAGALLNLLQNAWKYSKDDKRIALRVVRDDDFVVFEVEDHGIGIPRREQRRIFDRFYRVDTLLSRDTEGSGLGLSIAQRMVQAHDGWISVDSTVGKGSTFRLHLPRAHE